MCHFEFNTLGPGGIFVFAATQFVEFRNMSLQLETKTEFVNGTLAQSYIGRLLVLRNYTPRSSHDVGRICSFFFFL